MAYGKLIYKTAKNGKKYPCRIIPLKSYWYNGKLKTNWETRPVINLDRKTELKLQRQYIEKYGVTKLPPHIK